MDPLDGSLHGELGRIKDRAAANRLGVLTTTSRRLPPSGCRGVGRISKYDKASSLEPSSSVIAFNPRN
ncbi:unnamed protein product [Pieris macdunnoughi]|uniref:Uncharacterized protein n=1 Tax=Pieris macdunnoughi TaxID=345717 RepID=A0A821P219_9NEOP|nr:unnamed protein product [Pieris macdunnoughi]